MFAIFECTDLLYTRDVYVELYCFISIVLVVNDRKGALNGLNDAYEGVLLRFPLVINSMYWKGSLGAMVKAVALSLGGHGFKSWKQPLAKIAGKGCVQRPQVVRPFPRPCAKRELHALGCLYF
jgi:hypothetical protein